MVTDQERQALTKLLGRMKHEDFSSTEEDEALEKLLAADTATRLQIYIWEDIINDMRVEGNSNVYVTIIEHDGNGDTRQSYVEWVNSQIEAKWLGQEDTEDA